MMQDETLQIVDPFARIAAGKPPPPGQSCILNPESCICFAFTLDPLIP
jgi:hypothetical protein